MTDSASFIANLRNVKPFSVQKAFLACYLMTTVDKWGDKQAVVLPAAEKAVKDLSAASSSGDYLSSASNGHSPPRPLSPHQPLINTTSHGPYGKMAGRRCDRC